MSSSRKVELRWEGEGLILHGGSVGGPRLTVDSAREAGPSPTELILLGVAGCMGIDVINILCKGRVPLDALSVEATGERAESPPRKFVSIELVYRLEGPGEEDDAKVQRAIELSRDKYCSVLHTLDPAIPIEIRVERAPG